MFALVAFIKLYTGKGFEFIKNMCVFIDYEKGIIKSTHEELLGEIKRNIQLNLKVNPDNFPELIDIYNSCFSENILSYDIQDGNFKWRSWCENINFTLHINYPQKHIINFNELHIKTLMIIQLSMVMQCDA